MGKLICSEGAGVKVTELVLLGLGGGCRQGGTGDLVQETAGLFILLMELNWISMSPVLELLRSEAIGVEEETELVLMGFGGGGSKFRLAWDLG